MDSCSTGRNNRGREPMTKDATNTGERVPPNASVAEPSVAVPMIMATSKMTVRLSAAATLSSVSVR